MSTAKIINGKELSDSLRENIKTETEILRAKYACVPGLAVILAGEDEASKTYVANKEKACNNVGFYSEVIKLPENVTKDELIGLIKKLNNNENIHGILVQLPLPKHLDAREILFTVDPNKDVDGLHTLSAGRLLVGENGFKPCTPGGIIELVKKTGQAIAGKNAVIIGRSNIVGKPMALMLLNENATVTIAHSKTQNLAKLCADADILIAAIGSPKFVTKEFIKPGAIVIDVGTSRFNGKLCGDVDFDDVSSIAGYITPVPGGVGPMTITMLLFNTLLSFKNIHE